MPCLNTGRLSVIPEPKNRSVIVPLRGVVWDAIVMGFDDQQPDLVCGECEAVLVTGVDPAQFLSFAAAPDDRPLLHVPLGRYSVSSPMLAPPGVLVVAAEGNLVIECPNCRSCNDVGTVSRAARHGHR